MLRYHSSISTKISLTPLTARVFGLFCPFVSNLAVYWKPLPMVLLGLPALIFGTLSFIFLPETFGQALPQNMAEAMELNRMKQSNSKVYPK